jgi:hypothetical protein
MHAVGDRTWRHLRPGHDHLERVSCRERSSTIGMARRSRARSLARAGPNRHTRIDSNTGARPVGLAAGNHDGPQLWSSRKRSGKHSYVSIRKNDSSHTVSAHAVLRRTVEDAGLITRGFSQRPEGKLTAKAVPVQDRCCPPPETHEFSSKTVNRERFSRTWPVGPPPRCCRHDAPVGNVYRAVMVGEPWKEDRLAGAGCLVRSPLGPP